MPKDTHSTLPADAELVLPEQVTVALAELAGAAREGLLALAVGTGLGVLGSLLDADVDRLVGPKGRHNPARAAVRHGTQPGQVTLGGRRVRVDRPRVRAPMAPASWRCRPGRRSPGPQLLDQLALERMLAKLSTRRYQHWAGAGRQPGRAGRRTGTSKSAVSRRFVAATEQALAELLAADLSGLDLVALWSTASRSPSTAAWSRSGITLDGTKVPLGLAEGATENATVVSDLLAGLRERGLDTTRPILVVIDGAKALRRAVTDVFDHPVVHAASCTSSATSPTGSPTLWPRWWPSACAPPTTTPTRSSPRPSWRRWRESWTAPTQAPPLASRRTGRNPDHQPPGRATDLGPDPAQHQLHRVDDLHLSRSRRQRQTLAGRADGAALGRCRHG